MSYYSCGCFCSCGDDPCGCQQVVCPQCTTTTSTTTIPCIGEKCDELYDCACIIYNGPDLQCYGIKHGDTLCKILQIAAANLPSCATPSTTTTTTTLCPCVGYTVTAFKGAGVAVSYITCGGQKEIIDYAYTRPVFDICTQRGSVPQLVSGKAQIAALDPECCVTTTTTAAPLMQRCTVYQGYGEIERKWNDFPDTFTAVSIKLNGVEYVNSTTPNLNINSRADLVIGIGLDGTSHVMNVSDWVNTITRGSGFVFHDNMNVIDYPYAGATLDITLSMQDPGGTRSYYYDSTGFGFIGESYRAQLGTYTCAPLSKSNIEVIATG